MLAGPRQGREGRIRVRRLTLVVPAYNEGRRFDDRAYRAFLDRHGDVGLVLVDDGSTDDTLARLRRLAVHDPRRIGVVALPLNQGKAEAVRQGMLRALDEGGEYVGFWDADLATPLATAVAFCDLLDARPALEMVFGARVQLLGRTIRGKAIRHIVGRFFATAAAKMLDLQVYDTQCGAKVFRVIPSLKDLFAERFLSNWIFDVEILARLIAQRRGSALPQPEDVVYEQPVDEWRDIPGSNINPASYVTSILDATKLWRAYPLRPRLGRRRP